MNKTLLFIVNDASFFLSHRRPIADAAKQRGYQVHVAASQIQNIDAMLKRDFVYHRLPISRSGINLFSETKTLLAIWCIYRRLKPDIVHLVTIKPVLYGGILARAAKISSVVSAISGLGFVFSERNNLFRSIIKKISLTCYKFALSHPNQHIIFQNSNDMLLLNKGNSEKTSLIPGSGVNLNEYQDSPDTNEIPVVSMAARLLIDKGVLEFIEAARILKKNDINVKFQLIGEPDYGNPSSITNQQMESWSREGIVECMGFRSDIPDVFSKSSIVVLPSYYKEGFPKVLIEAAACGRSVITTDLPGCRDAIIPDTTGILIPARDPFALAVAIEELCVNKEKRLSMGNAGRKLAEEKYSIEDVVIKHLTIYENLLVNKINN